MTAVEVGIEGATIAVPVAVVAKPRRPDAAWRSRLLRLVSVAAAIGLWQLLTAGHVRFWLRFDTLPTVTQIVGALTRAL
ncbi:MAG TPA: ABC transporter permease, partial [Mycobacterium sp.]